MNPQDFACRISDIVWGGEFGWDSPGGLERLAEAVRLEFKKNRPPPAMIEKNKSKNDDQEENSLDWGTD